MMMNHSYVNVGEEFESNSGKIEESGKILGKDLWVRSHSKETLLNDLKDRLRQLN